MLTFPYGKAAFCIFILCLFSGAWISLHPIAKKKTTLVMWTFAKTHHEAYLAAIPSFETSHPGVTVEVRLVNGQAVGQRLQAAFWADLDVPDLTEVEIGTAGTFFRGPLNSIGFADLTDRVKSTGLWDKMVQSRFAPYTSHGHIFGLPHDVHPVQLAYRRDLFEAAGIDVSKIQTWENFIAIYSKSPAE